MTTNQEGQPTIIDFLAKRREIAGSTPSGPTSTVDLARLQAAINAMSPAEVERIIDDGTRIELGYEALALAEDLLEQGDVVRARRWLATAVQYKIPGAQAVLDEVLESQQCAPDKKPITKLVPYRETIPWRVREVRSDVSYPQWLTTGLLTPATAEAQREAQAIVSDARAEADRIMREAEARAVALQNKSAGKAERRSYLLSLPGLRDIASDGSSPVPDSLHIANIVLTGRDTQSRWSLLKDMDWLSQLGGRQGNEEAAGYLVEFMISTCVLTDLQLGCPSRIADSRGDVSRLDFVRELDELRCFVEHKQVTRMQADQHLQRAEHRILERIITGPDVSLRSTVDKYARRYVLDHDDLYQATCERLRRHDGKVSEHERPRDWLDRCVNFVALDKIKDRSRQPLAMGEPLKMASMASDSAGWEQWLATRLERTLTSDQVRTIAALAGDPDIELRKLAEVACSGRTWLQSLMPFDDTHYQQRVASGSPHPRMREEIIPGPALSSVLAEFSAGKHDAAEGQSGKLDSREVQLELLSAAVPE